MERPFKEGDILVVVSNTQKIHFFSPGVEVKVIKYNGTTDSIQCQSLKSGSCQWIPFEDLSYPQFPKGQKALAERITK